MQNQEQTVFRISLTNTDEILNNSQTFNTTTSSLSAFQIAELSNISNKFQFVKFVTEVPGILVDETIDEEISEITILWYSIDQYLHQVVINRTEIVEAGKIEMTPEDLDIELSKLCSNTHSDAPDEVNEAETKSSIILV